MVWGLVLILAAPATRLEEAETKARQALTAGKKAEALDWWEQAYRLADDQPTKNRLRDAYLKTGWAEPRAISDTEIGVVTAAIRAEKLRIWIKAAERLERRKQLHAAVLVWREVQTLGGTTTPDGKTAAAALKRITEKLTLRATDEEKALARKIVEGAKGAPDILAKARKLKEDGQWRVATRVLQELEFGDYPREAKDAARTMREDVRTTALAAVPPDERTEAIAIRDDERFKRLDVNLSRHFIYLGPDKFVKKLSEQDRTRMDLGYIVQSDLASAHVTYNNVRILLYYQETLDFGGGLASGKKIRIGRPAIRAPLNMELHFHELGHTIFGRGWLTQGFTEGLAEFAVGFTLDGLGFTNRARNHILACRRAFTRFYLGRDVAHYDIQSYKPSAGFFFSLLPAGDAPYDWAPYRRVFHRMREAQWGFWPVRDHQFMRYFGYLLSTEYGADVLELLEEWRFPVQLTDRTTVPEETESLLQDVKASEVALIRGLPQKAGRGFRRALSKNPRSALAARCRWGLLQIAAREGDAETATRLRRSLGIVDQWWVLGPFHARQRTAHAVLPPETGTLDLQKPVRYGVETGVWKPAKNISPTGAVDLKRQGFGYPDHACAFALVYIRAPKRTEARIWIGADDGHHVLLNGHGVGRRILNRGFRFDDHVHDVVLREGWNRLLVKVHNRTGAWGFLLRLVGRDGRPLEGLEFSVQSKEKELAPEPAAARKRSGVKRAASTVLLKDEFKSLNKSRWRVTVGRFDTRNGQLQPEGTKNSGWNRFTVNPDKGPSGPTNLAWVQHKDLPDLDDLRITLVFPTPKKKMPGKFGIALDGEQGGDAQSGHTFVIEPKGKGLSCHWYRYEHLHYLQQGVPLPKESLGEQLEVVLERRGSKWTLRANGVLLFDRVDSPRLPAFGVGFMSWGRGPVLESFKLTRLD